MDLGDVALLRARSWSWFTALVTGVLQARSRTLWCEYDPSDRDKIVKALANGAEVTPWL